MTFLQQHLTIDHATRLLRAGELDDAESICRALLKRDKRHVDAIQLRGAIALKKRDYAGALKHYQRCLAIRPKEPHFHFLLGKVLAIDGRYTEALKKLDKALELQPDHMNAAEYKALVHQWDGDYDAAAAVLKPYVRAGRENAGMAEVQARIDIHAGRYREAARIAERHLAGGELDPDTRHLLGHVAGSAWEKLGEHARSFEAHTRANQAVAIPFDRETINRACYDAVRENKLDTGYIRTMCFYGSESMGIRADNLKVHAMVAAWPWAAYLGADGLENGIRIKTSSYVRHHVNSTMWRAKATGNYMNSMLALQEALDCGYDEALLLDAEGYVSEGSGENIFIVRNGRIITPDPTSALEGITRDTVIKLAEEIGLTVSEKRITRDEVYIADEAFFTGTAAEVTPIRELDGRTIGDGGRGPISEKLQGIYFDQVHGRRDEYPEWLTYVDR